MKDAHKNDLEIIHDLEDRIWLLEFNQTISNNIYLKLNKYFEERAIDIVKIVKGFEL